LIGGLPLLQAIAITFTGAPIPFAKIGKFPPESLKKIIEDIKQAIKDGKSALSALKAEFHNALDRYVDKPLKNAVERLDTLTANGFAKLQTALPGLFAKTGSVATARQALLDRIGSVTAYANDANNKMMGMTLNDWSMLGNTLYDSVQTFKNHTNALSGVQTDDKYLTLDTIYGKVLVSNGTVNVASGSNVAYANLSQSTYPSINVGDTLTINTQIKVVTGLSYNSVAGGTVSVTADDYNVTTSSVASLNLANISLGTGSLKLGPDMYIKVNNEIKQIESINAYGDYLTVYSTFRDNASGSTLYTEVGFTVNSNFTTSNTNALLYKTTAFCANSECLGNVIYGQGTTFTANISAGNKVYYDEQEFNVISVTDTEIVVDAPLRLLSDEMIYKVIKEEAVFRLTDTMNPDDILATFDAADTMTSAFGENYINGLTTRFMAANGETMQVDAYKPVHVTQSLQKPELMRAVSRTVQSLIDDLQDDAIRHLSDGELVSYLEQRTQEIDDMKNRLMDSVNQDIASFNAIKGLLQGLLKLFQTSCSKKKKGDDPESPNTSSDDYLQLITIPNPTRQGCDATESDLITLLDDADAEYKTVDYPTVDVDTGTVTDTNVDDFIDPNAALFVPERSQTGGGLGDIELDGDADGALPAKTVDPCTQPC